MIVEISQLLYRLGITAKYTGFYHASFAVQLCLENPERLLLVSKWLYPEVARHFDTTVKAVERNIRTVAAIAWSCNPDLLVSLARRPLNGRPPTAQFIAIIAFSLSCTEVPA